MLFKDIDISKMFNILMLSKNCIIELQNHRNVVWKGPPKALSPPPRLKQGYCRYQKRSAMALSSQALKTCKHRDSITFPGNLSQYCIDFLMIFFPLVFNLNFLNHILWQLPIFISLAASQ